MAFSSVTLRVLSVVAVAAVAIQAQQNVSPQPSTGASIIDGVSQFTAPTSNFAQDAQANLQEQLQNAQKVVQESINNAQTAFQDSLNNAQAAVQDGINGVQDQLARLGAPIFPATQSDSAVTNATTEVIESDGVEQLFGRAAAGAGTGSGVGIEQTAGDLLRDAQSGLENTNRELASLLQRSTSALNDLQGRMANLAREAAANVPTMQANAPVGRVFTNQPFARGGLNVVRDFLDSLRRVRESESGVSAFQRLVTSEGPGSVEGSPEDTVFMQQLLAEARNIQNERGQQQATGAGPAGLAAMSSVSPSPAANATAIEEAKQQKTKNLAAPAAVEHQRIPREIFQELCNSPLLNERGRVNFTDVDKAYARAHRPAADIRVPNGCVHGCVIGTGFFETVARTYGAERTQTLASWRGKCFDADNKVSNRIAVADRLGLIEPMKMFEGDLTLADSFFAPGEKSAVVNYSAYDHEFSSFRDEYREVYPGVYLGKMYAMPGTRMYGILNVPADSAPVFAVNFLLLHEDPEDVKYIAPATTRRAF